MDIMSKKTGRRSVMLSSLMTLSMVLLSLFQGSTSSSPTNAKCLSAIYAFGDSLTDTGNAVIAEPVAFATINSSPYGETYFGKPTGRCSDGRLVIDFLADSLVKEFLPPYLQVKEQPLNQRYRGVNFAVAGSTALDRTVLAQYSIFSLTDLNLAQQTPWFQQLKSSSCTDQADPACAGNFGNALYFLGEIGANDYIFGVYSNQPVTVLQKLTPLIISQIQNTLQTVIDNGARYILVEGVPPLGCAPAILESVNSQTSSDYDSYGCLSAYNKLSQMHNSLIMSLLSKFRAQNADVEIMFADFYAIAERILHNPRAYGFERTVTACCGSGGGKYNFDLISMCGSKLGNVTVCPETTKYSSWDGIHLTEAAYKVAADFFMQSLKSFPLNLCP